jgi:hypothetical protein
MLKFRNKVIDLYTKYQSNRSRGIRERERCNGVGQCFMAVGFRESKNNL